MNDEILQEFYDLVYEQAVEDTVEYLNEKNEYLEEQLARTAALSAAGAGLGYAGEKYNESKKRKNLEKLKKSRFRNRKEIKKLKDELDQSNTRTRNKMLVGGVFGPVGAGVHQIVDLIKDTKKGK